MDATYILATVFKSAAGKNKKNQLHNKAVGEL